MKQRDIVLDASVALDLVLRQPIAALIRTQLVDWVAAGRQILVPSHFWLEVINSLAVRHGWDPGATIAAIHELDEFGLRTVEVDRPLQLLAISRCERFRLSGYDAAYIAIAEAFGAEIATHDRQMMAVAEQLGLVPTGKHRLGEERGAYGSEPTEASLYLGWAGRYVARLRADAQRELEAARG